MEHPVSDRQPMDSGEEYARLFEDALTRRSRLFDRDRALMVGVSFPGIRIEEEQAFSVRTAMSISFSEASMRVLERRLGGPPVSGQRIHVPGLRRKEEPGCAHRRRGGNARSYLYQRLRRRGRGHHLRRRHSHRPLQTPPGSSATFPWTCTACPAFAATRGCLEQYVNLNAIFAQRRRGRADNAACPPRKPSPSLPSAPPIWRPFAACWKPQPSAWLSAFIR